ncbi:MAG: autotransporter-associated beta strand repeat-containing protein [Burkholderiales bacterium]|nr:autotransporter-associated beta strand repeat-containing protein [Opitutaceae bacterium]
MNHPTVSLSPKLLPAAKLLLAMSLLGTAPLFGQINTWTGATGNWNTAGNWSNNVIPNATNVDVIFGSGGVSQTLNLSANTSIQRMYLYGGNYTLSPSNSEVLNLAGGGGFTQLDSGTFTVTNNITTTGSLVFNGTGNGAITFSGTINNGANTWEKWNESNVTLTNGYTTTSTSGNALRVRAGSLILSGNGTVTQGAAAQITLGFAATYGVGRYHNNGTAALILDNTGTNNTNRITDGNQINFNNRGLLEFRGNASAASTETLGILNTSFSTGPRLRVDSNGGQSAWLTFSSLSAGNSLTQFLVPSGDSLGATGTAGGRVIFTTAPGLTNGVLRYGIVKDESNGGGATFATYDSTVDNGQHLGVKALGSYTTTTLSGATNTQNVDATGDITLGANSSANALRINTSGAGQALTMGSNTLNIINAAGLIFNGGNDYSINNTSGTGVTLNGPSYVYINSNTLTINAPVVRTGDFIKAGDGALVINGTFANSASNTGVDDGAAVDDMSINGVISGSKLTKTGQGVLVLGGSGSNSAFSGGVDLNAGTIVLNKSDNTLQNNALGTGTFAWQGGTITARDRAAVIANTVNLGTQGGANSGNQMAGDQAITFSGLVQGSASSGQNYPVVNNASGLLTLSGTVQGFNANNASAQTATITFSGSGNTTISGVLRNTDPTFVNAATMVTGIAKDGSGLLTLSNANTYTGNTQVNGGYLRLDNASALGAGYLEIGQAAYADGWNAVVELGTGNTAFNRALGTAAGQVRLGGNSGNNLNNAGFAAVSGTATVNLGGAGAAVTWGGGSFFNAGGSLVLGSPNVAGTVDFQNGINLGGNRTVTALNGSNAVDGIISGQIRNQSGGGGTARSLIKTGAGTLSLTGANDYSGGTTISAGTLLANSSTATGSGAVTVALGATLGGGGTVPGATTVNGTLAPGNSAGLLSFGSSLALNNSASFEINGATIRGTDYDAVNVTGALTYGGTLTASFGTTFTEGSYSFDLFNFGGQSGTFGSVSIAGSYSGVTLNSGNGYALVDGINTWSFNHSDGVLGLTVSAIPEPSAFAALAGLGALGLAAIRRRHSAKNRA